MMKDVYRSACKLPVINVRFKWNLNFLDSFSKNTQISKLMKICPVETELFHANGHAEANSRFFAISRTRPTRRRGQNHKKRAIGKCTQRRLKLAD